MEKFDKFKIVIECNLIKEVDKDTILQEIAPMVTHDFDHKLIEYSETIETILE